MIEFLQSLATSMARTVTYRHLTPSWPQSRPPVLLTCYQWWAASNLAPTDKAFASLPKDQLEALMADPKALGDFLRAYIVEGYYPPYTLGGDVDGDNFEPDRTVINLLGKELVLSSTNGSLSINSSNMEDAGNSMVANGSRVLLVQNLMEP
jgi:hypothetical protein